MSVPQTQAALTHWPLGERSAISKIRISVLFYQLIASDFLMMMPSDECHRTLVMISQHWFRWWLGAVRQQVITCANVDLYLCHHMASLGLNELTHCNTLTRQNRHHFADDRFKCIFLNENLLSLIKISLKFIPMGPVNNIPAFVQIMAWRWSGNKSLSEPVMIILLMHISVTWPQWY